MATDWLTFLTSSATFSTISVCYGRFRILVRPLGLSFFPFPFRVKSSWCQS